MAVVTSARRDRRVDDPGCRTARADPQGAAPVERDDSHDGRSQQARDPCLAGATA